MILDFVFVYFSISCCACGLILCFNIFSPSGLGLILGGEDGIIRVYEIEGLSSSAEPKVKEEEKEDVCVYVCVCVLHMTVCYCWYYYYTGVSVYCYTVLECRLDLELVCGFDISSLHCYLLMLLLRFWGGGFICNSCMHNRCITISMLICSYVSIIIKLLLVGLGILFLMLLFTLL